MSEYNLRFLLTTSNGLKSDFKFPSSPTATTTIQEVKEHIYNNWPNEWSAENKTESVKNFRILYRGRFLLDSDTLDSTLYFLYKKLQIPLNEVTTMHLVIKIDANNGSGGGGGDEMNKSVVHSFVKSDSGLYGIVTTTTTSSASASASESAVKKKKKDYIVQYDLQSLQENPIVELDAFPSGGVVIRDHLVYCCFNNNNNNCLRVYDRRVSSGKVMMECTFEKIPPITCMDVCNYDLAIGTEMLKEDSFVRLYDLRSISNSYYYTREFTESFSNDLSQLEFYRGFLLSSSTDGLSCLFDLNSSSTSTDSAEKEKDEDDYLIRVFNSDAAIYRFGTYCDEYLYTMSHQNTVQLFNMNSGSKMFDYNCSTVDGDGIDGVDGSGSMINCEAVGSDLIVYTQQEIQDNQYRLCVNRCTLENGLEKIMEFQSDAYVNDARILLLGGGTGSGGGESGLFAVGAATDDGIRVFSSD